jgi:LemA protein
MSSLEIVVGVVPVVIVAAAVVLFNDLVRLRNECDRAFANIDVLLRQRADELPNLVNVCQAYARFEQGTLAEVAEARATTGRAATPAQAEAAARLTARVMGTLLMVAEQYPVLAADRSFRALQQRITGLENEIADRREFFNQTVTAWNTRIEQFPDALIAGPFLKARRRALLKLAGIENVKVSLAA